MSGKKKNFTLQERSLLLELLTSYKNVINNKKTDNFSAAAKKAAWMEIAEGFNASDKISESASGEQLRRLWTNLKTRQKEAIIKGRKYSLTTGDCGPCEEVKVKPEVTILMEIPNANDSDSIDDQASEIPIIPSSSLICSNTNSSPIHPSTSIQIHSPTTTSTQIYASTEMNSEENYSIEKIRNHIFEKEHMNREKRAFQLHNLQIQHLQEKHKIEIEILQLQKEKVRAEVAQVKQSNNNNY